MKKAKGKANPAVVIKNPETGQTMTTTAKNFEAIYAAKGFEMTDEMPAIHSDEDVEYNGDDTPRPKLRHDDVIVVKHSTTGQVMETTSKLFDSIYRDKGFQIVTRGNVDQAAKGSKSAKTSKRQPVSHSEGNAADVAARLGITAEPEQAKAAAASADRTTSEPALPQATTDPDLSDAIETDVDNAVTEERPSHRRDRGRNS